MRNAKKTEFKLTKIALAVSAALCFTQPAFAVPANATLPSVDKVVIGGNNVKIESDKANNVMNIKQDVTTSVIKWKDFSVGADATVNFVGKNGKDFDGYNSVNFVNSGKVSEIYGRLNANGGNIVIANKAGVQIGSSAQINVGSLYITNKDISNLVDDKKITETSSYDDIKTQIATLNQQNAAELMSMGGIVASKEVVFDGDRVVIDTDHLYQNDDGTKLDIDNKLTVKTKNTDNVVLGYTAYDQENHTYKTEKNANKKFKVVQKDGSDAKEEVTGYMWVENLLQLQAMETKLDGNYALRNSIDANFSADAEYYYLGDKDKGTGFNPIGNTTEAFTGNFDGLGFDIFDLNIKGNNNCVGLFGKVENATIRNFTLNSGAVSGKNYVGSAIGYAVNSRIENIINTADIFASGNKVGGIVGYAKDSTLSGLINTGTVTVEETANNLSNLGGIVGYIESSTING